MPERLVALVKVISVMLISEQWGNFVCVTSAEALPLGNKLAEVKPEWSFSNWNHKLESHCFIKGHWLDFEALDQISVVRKLEQFVRQTIYFWIF